MESIFRLYSELPIHKKDALILLGAIHIAILIIIFFILALVLTKVLDYGSFIVVLILLGVLSGFTCFGFYNDWKRVVQIQDNNSSSQSSRTVEFDNIGQSQSNTGRVLPIPVNPPRAPPVA